MILEPYMIDFGQIGASDLGYLTFIENKTMPFEVKRIYWTYYSPDNIMRGHHAHKKLQQVIFAMSGSIVFYLENSQAEQYTFTLNSPRIGLFIPEMYWRTFKMSHDAVLLCLASLEYDETDYIRNYEEFKQKNV
jgi:hypothetical protein